MVSEIGPMPLCTVVLLNADAIAQREVARGRDAVGQAQNGA